MMSDFESRNSSKPTSPEDGFTGQIDNPHQPTGARSMLQRDRFELLSAYLDGEVTAAERKQVEEWLATDPVVKRLYTRLLELRQGLQAMPVPAASQSVDQTVDAVFKRVNRRPKQLLLWGGAAVAALFVGAVSGFLPGNNSFSPQFAQSPIEGSGAAQNAQLPSSAQPVNSDALMIALDQPVVEIPKAPVSLPADAVEDIHNDSNDNIR
ncbi:MULTISPECIES: anti-sigma factor [Trichocoleus]|uniref:Zf-HC2 domain-containing protein n=1 Tax=Trichocoleus desertorum GB2-A4 TaxID=2933944 RepID=A0ABV0J729_9CYAN|nr:MULTISPECIES: zf-HC2 domain-containing protein [unclassified Trichocoleus]